VAEWVPLGDRAIRFPRPPGSSPQVLVRTIRSWPGVSDVVVARDDVAVYFDVDPRVDPARLDALAGLGGAGSLARTIEIAAVYDGPDLADVASAAGMSDVDVARIHAAGVYEVDSMGFAPGFAYLIGVDPRLHIQRRATPRTRVPAGSIALAGGYTGVYPFDSPGGWHLIGHVVGARMFSEQGAFLRLGDRVRFVR
jgi:UPF0271 protein